MKSLSALISGILFGMGLAISGMTDTEKVIGFQNIFGNWVPDLVFVMGAAVLATAIGFKLLFRLRAKPLFDVGFSIPKNKIIDRKLIIGAIVFGIGWGLYGYCPGPAVASIIYLSPVTLIFIFTMVVGMFIGNIISKRMQG